MEYTHSAMPVVFVSHGSPMQAMEDDEVSRAWATLGTALPRPRAILAVSAHWESNLPLLTGSGQPETIHDFGGFPDELYTLAYPAPGDPALAQRAQSLLREAGFTAGIDGTRGLDHGAWVPLLHMFPQAGIPVVQLSIQTLLGAAHHFALGRALMALRDDGVLILASGHMTHNLRDFFRPSDSTSAYAVAFRDWVHARVIDHRFDDLLAWQQIAPHALRAHPTAEHFMPLFVALGAAGPGYRVESVIHGYAAGVLALDAYRFEAA